MMKKAQRLGTALMQAVAVMPVAAILMGIGYWIDPTGWGSENFLAAVLIGAGNVILGNLGVIFAIAVAFGLSKDKNGATALSAWIGFEVIKILLDMKMIANVRGVPFEEIQKLKNIEGWGAIGNGNVFLGILVGVIAALVYERFHTVELPAALAFFSGRRLVPIIMSFVAILMAGGLYFVWPLFYKLLVGLGTGIAKMGAVGAGIYAFFNRLLIPTGLHHALNNIFWFDTVGINDIPNFLGGAKSIAEGTGKVGVTGMYQAGFFPIMMFGLPGAALAMFRNAKPEKKKMAFALLSAGAAASFFTGVTEPLEFSFMFLAPVLYVVHAAVTGLSVFLAATFHWTAGFGFSAGLVDMVLSSRNPLANKWYMLLVMGVVFFAIYYFLFSFLIKKLNLKTPGREDDQVEGEETLVMSNNNYAEAAKIILEGVGGKENVRSFENCITRLRLEINDYTQVNEKKIKEAGVAGVIRPGQHSVHVVVGPQVEHVANEFKKLV